MRSLARANSRYLYAKTKQAIEGQGQVPSSKCRNNGLGLAGFCFDDAGCLHLLAAGVADLNAGPR